MTTGLLGHCLEDKKERKGGRKKGNTSFDRFLSFDRNRTQGQMVSEGVSHLKAAWRVKLRGTEATCGAEPEG